ncbi:MAG: hypothetical protein LBU23_06710 [Planctomycetota bacterium]|jgi:hypothetical protein|nr:hypothetical protein [Planctomycetota bacterium]
MGLREEMYGDGWLPEEMLAGDADGRGLREVLEALSQSQARLKAELDRGVAPDQFKKGQALLTSYEAAKQGLEKAWAKKHPET